MASTAAIDEPSWVAPSWEALRAAGVGQVAYVPDAGLSALITRAHAAALEPDPTVKAVPLTSEQEGVALLAGAWLGGRRGVLLMQSSGVGNCVNMLSLAQNCRFPLLMVVTMRGQWGERNPWQVPMGSTAATVLRSAGALVFEAASAAEVASTIAAAADMVWTGPAVAAVLIHQRVLGAKAFTTADPALAATTINGTVQ